MGTGSQGVPTAAADHQGPAPSSPVPSQGQSCVTTSPPLDLAAFFALFIVHKAELAPLKGHCRAGGCAQPMLSLVPLHLPQRHSPTLAAVLTAPLALLQARSTLRAAG